jgi:S-methylmethionine-dependent homocysteine/selenocysteine methylase
VYPASIWLVPARSFSAERAPELITPFIEEQREIVNFWLVETISSLTEAKTIFNLLTPTNKPIWLSFNIADSDDDHSPAVLRTGKNINDIIQWILTLSHPPQSILFNCSAPERITQAIKELGTALKANSLDISYGGYANSFVCNKKHDGSNKVLTALNTELTPEAYLEYAQSWKELGATIIGGCCGIGPEHIAKLAKAL